MIVAGYSIKAWWLGVSIPASVGVVTSWALAGVCAIVIGGVSVCCRLRRGMRA